MPNPLHSAAAGTELHDLYQYVQSGDPGAVGTNKNWLDTTTAAAPIHKRRNAGNNGWIIVGTPSVLTAKGDVLTFDGTNYVKQAVGADGTALVADSTQTTGMRWQAVGGGGLSDPTTTKGDLIVRGTSAVTRLPVGTDGQIIQADSTQSSGMKWTSAGAGYTDPLTTKGDLVVRNATVTTRKAAGSNALGLLADSSQADGLAWGTPAFRPPSIPSGALLTINRMGFVINIAATLVMVANTLYGHMIWVNRGESYSSVVCKVTTIAAGKSIRMGIWNYDPTTRFGAALVVDAGTVDAGVSGLKTATANMPWVCPDSNWYILGGVSDGTPTVQSFSAGTQVTGTTDFANTLGLGITRSQTYGALPNPWGGSNTLSLAGIMAFGLTAS